MKVAVIVKESRAAAVCPDAGATAASTAAAWLAPAPVAASADETLREAEGISGWGGRLLTATVAGSRAPHARVPAGAWVLSHGVTHRDTDKNKKSSSMRAWDLLL
jgi:hypothetical protein